LGFSIRRSCNSLSRRTRTSASSFA
jgi:hypothetical protein